MCRVDLAVCMTTVMQIRPPTVPKPINNICDLYISGTFLHFSGFDMVCKTFICHFEEQSPLPHVKPKTIGELRCYQENLQMPLFGNGTVGLIEFGC